MQHLGQRRQAVGGAGGIGDDLLAAQQLVIDPVDHGQVGAFQRVREQHARGAGGQVLFDVRALLQLAGALQHQVDAEPVPGQVDHLAFAQQVDRLLIDLHRVFVQADMPGKAAEGRVEAGQVHQGDGIAQVIDRDQMNPLLQLALEQRAQHCPTDASVAIDSDAQHGSLLVGCLLSA
ncbi:hypothetical protein D3C84_885770 [compost metagenome]